MHYCALLTQRGGRGYTGEEAERTPPAWITVASGSNANVDTVSCYITHGDFDDLLHTADALWVERDVKGAVHKPTLSREENPSAYPAKLKTAQ